MAQLSDDQKKLAFALVKMATADAGGYEAQAIQLRKSVGLTQRGDAMRADVLDGRAMQLRMFISTMESIRVGDHATELIDGWISA